MVSDLHNFPTFIKFKCFTSKMLESPFIFYLHHGCLCVKEAIGQIYFQLHNLNEEEVQIMQAFVSMKVQKLKL